MDPWRILVVDDIADIAEQTADVIRADPSRSADVDLVVDVETSFNAALDLIESKQIDLLVLDVRDQGVAAEDGDKADPDEQGSEVTEADTGLAVFKKVRDRRFVPVVFFTGLPNLVDAELLRSPFVQLVSKNDTESTAHLRSAVNAVLNSTLPSVHRALNGHVQEVVREFMTDFVEVHWDELKAPSRKGDLAHLLLRRLALSLADGGGVLSSRLADETVAAVAEDNVHPMRFYVLPPIGDFTTGDLVVAPPHRSSPDKVAEHESEAFDEQVAPPDQQVAPPDQQVAPPDQQVAPPDEQVAEGSVEGPETWYVVLTPACDLVPARLKADYVVLAECVPLETAPEYRAWVDARPQTGQTATREANKAEKALAGLMRNNRQGRPADRDFFLPAAWSIPNLLVDFQRISSVTVEDLMSKHRRVATLDSPYVEALVESFSRYLGRRGTPDLDTSLTIAQLEP